MSGTLHQRIILKAFPINKTFLIEMLIPFFMGIIAIVAHAKLRMHLGIPGHNGLIFMSLMLIAHKTSKLKWSSIIFSVGVGSMLYIPFLGFGDPFAVFVYLWPGIIFNSVYLLHTKNQSKAWFIALVGGLAYASIPFSRFILGIITGLMHKSIINGLLLPFLSFFIFGLLGALIGIGAIQIFLKIKK